MEYSILPHIIPANIFPFPDCRREYFDSAQYILCSPRLHIEYSVLPHIIPANIIPQPRLSTAIFFLS